MKRKPYKIEVVNYYGESSPERRTKATEELRAVKVKTEALTKEYDEIIKAHPELQRLKAELANLRKERNELQSRVLYHRFRAVRRMGIFNEIFAEGDTLAECHEKAKAKLS